MKEKSINNVLNAIEQSKGAELSKFIKSLGIHLVGATAANLILEEIGDDWLDAKYEDLVKIKGIGEETAHSFIEYVKDNKQIVLDLLSVVKPVKQNKKPSAGNVVLTGKFINGDKVITRNELSKLIEDAGFHVQKSVTKDTHFLIAGDKASPDKVKKFIENSEKIMEDNDTPPWLKLTYLNLANNNKLFKELRKVGIKIGT